MSERRCAVVAVLGAPNAGKSTLVNALVGAKVAAVTQKVQTTRALVRGIAMRNEVQLILIDTPGVFAPKRRFDRAMVAAAWSAIEGVDAIVHVVDVAAHASKATGAERHSVEDSHTITKALDDREVGSILVLNKVDAVDRPALLEITRELVGQGRYTDVFMISAKKGDGVDDLARTLAERAPVGPWLFPEDQIMDAPTRVLAGFDPAATPPVMVDWMSALTPQEVLDQFASTNEALLGAVCELTDEEWSAVAESPPGHVPIRLLAQHALWDSWVHERDVAIPLGIDTAAEPDELTSCLRYAAAVSPALGIGLGHGCTGTFAVEATDPSIRFVLDVGDSISVREEVAAATVPCLRGDAVTLIEALSLRAPLPPSTPIEWSQLLGGLAKAFDAV